jgi:O-antigen/teichoic acid export membrane protein
MLSSLLRAQDKPLYFAVFNISNALLSFILTILFLAFLKWGWAGRIIAQIITASILILFTFIYFYYNDLMRFSLTKRLIKKIYFYGIPLIPHGVGNFIIAYTDRLFITKYVGLTETGIYTVGHRVATVISLIVASFCSAFLPWQFRKLKHGNPNEVIKMMKVIYLVILLIIILTIVMNLLFPLFFKYLIGKEYANGKVYAQWISLGAAFLGMYSVSAGFLFYYEKTKYLAYVTLIVAALNIGLNYILIKKNGAIGAAQATAIVYFLKFLSVFLLSIFLFKLPAFLRKK